MGGHRTVTRHLRRVHDKIITLDRTEWPNSQQWDGQTSSSWEREITLYSVYSSLDCWCNAQSNYFTFAKRHQIALNAINYQSADRFANMDSRSFRALPRVDEGEKHCCTFFLSCLCYSEGVDDDNDDVRKSLTGRSIGWRSSWPSWPIQRDRKSIKAFSSSLCLALSCESYTFPSSYSISWLIGGDTSRLPKLRFCVCFQLTNKEWWLTIIDKL